ncbi:MAG: DUF4230 domain-containing protein [Chloroflexi bacterium]|nr:DUF4230 domain-containing protein [Chloroflexota bacterium]MQC26979.1 DUF4230 domain-containing protein [Chloroflexota bacterium]
MTKNRIFLIAGTAAVLMVGVLAFGAYRLVAVVWDTAEAGLAPARDLASSVATEVANVLHPMPTILPDPVTIVREVRSLARLETIQYSVEKVIVAESGQGPFGFLFGDRLLFIAHGSVIAGIDLEKIGPEDLLVQDGVLFVTLPESEVFVVTLNNEQSYIYDREVGALTRGNQQLETEARQAAEQEILASALEDNILAQAQVNAENFLYRLLLDLGFPEVIFVDSATD